MEHWLSSGECLRDSVTGPKMRKLVKSEMARTNTACATLLIDKQMELIAEDAVLSVE
jgi:hypothetical protein